MNSKYLTLFNANTNKHMFHQEVSTINDTKLSSLNNTSRLDDALNNNFDSLKSFFTDSSSGLITQMSKLIDQNNKILAQSDKARFGMLHKVLTIKCVILIVKLRMKKAQTRYSKTRFNNPIFTV